MHFVLDYYTKLYIYDNQIRRIWTNHKNSYDAQWYSIHIANAAHGINVAHAF